MIASPCGCLGGFGTNVAVDVPRIVVHSPGDERVYVFVGLERVGGIMIYDVTDPTAPEFVTWANNTDWQGSFEEETFTGDISPEGVLFISAEDSPNGAPLLVVTNEDSGTTTVYEINVE